MKINKILLGIAIALVIYLGISSFGLFSNIKGSGNVIKETRKLEVFHAIDVGGAFHLTVKQGEPQSVIVEADDNIMPTITTKVKNGELEINNNKSINNATKLNITIVVANLDDLDISGASKLQSVGLFSSNTMDIESSGASSINMELKCKKLSLDFSGASKGTFEGSTKELKIDASGASHVDCFGLESEVATADASGASNISLVANRTLRIEASGASDVNYKSNGASVEVETSGAANAHKK